jgi:NADH:ubiquinone oxidoreductase subunit E
LHQEKLKEREENKDLLKCNCQTGPSADVRSVVDAVVASTGRESDKLIMILQEVQKRLNYLPSEALKHICEVTEITPGQISGVSTFYSQFRHLPAGIHTVKVCAGTACHVKGAPLISDAFKRVLKIDDTRNASPDNLFSIEEVACLGCCTLAPVVQIDGKTYGHVKPTQVEEIIKDFLKSGNGNQEVPHESVVAKVDAEVRIGLGSCCVAGGSREILSEIMYVRDRFDLSIKLKPVGCVGVCNQTPLMEIVTGDNKSFRYTNVRTQQVEEILLKHIKPGKVNKRLKSNLFDLVDTFLSDDKLSSQINLPDEYREKHLNNFLNHQIHIATINSGILTPDSYDEYAMLGGFSALKECLNEIGREEIIKIISDSGLRGRGGAGFPTGRKWSISMEAAGDLKYVVCNGDEGDPGAFMDRMLLESFPFRIIEGLIIAGFVSGAREGIFYIRAEYPLACSRIRSALEKCYAQGILGESVCGTDFSFDIALFEGAGAFVCGEETALIASLEGKPCSQRIQRKAHTRK